MRGSLHRAAPRWHNTASQRKARGSNFMLQTHIKCPVTVTTSGWRGPEAYLLGISFPQSSAWIKELTLLLCPECVRCLVLRLIVPAFLEKKKKKSCQATETYTVQAFCQGNGILSHDPRHPTTPSYYLFILTLVHCQGCLREERRNG